MESVSCIHRPLMEEHRNLKVSEKTALENLKEKLNSAYKNNKVSMWGIPLSMTSSSTESEVILLKFLRATNFIVEDSFKKLVNCLSWRKKFGADSIVEEKLLFQDIESSVAWLYNFDRQGRPVCYINYSTLIGSNLHDKIFLIEENRPKFIRWRVQVLERAIKMLNFNPAGVHSIIMVYDMKYSWTREIEAVEDHLYSIIQDNYPGIVSSKIEINVPWIEILLNSIYSRFFTQSDSAMGELVIANKDNVFETLFKYIRPECIPIKYGGLSNDYELKNAYYYIFETKVEGGEKLSIPVDGIEVGSIITLDLMVGGWDLEYSVKFIPDAVTSFANMVVKPMKMEASDIAKSITFFLKEVGKYVLSIDNTASKKQKVVCYQYTVTKSEHGYYGYLR